MKQKRKVLLTGGSGFIGRNILGSFLVDKYRIIAPSHAELDLANDEIVRDFFKKDKFDAVIHSAIKPGHRNAKDPANLFYADSRIFFNLVRNAGAFDRLIVLSSGSVYDMMRQDLRKVGEDHFDTIMPVDEHGFFRYVSAKFMEHMDRVAELRIFGLFGKYEDYSIRFVSNAICKTVHDLPITIKQDRMFDFLYIDDLMPVLDHFMQSRRFNHNAYNVTPDNAISLYRVAEKVREISGKDLPIVVGRPGMASEYSGNNSRLREEMRGLELHDIDEAIAKLYGWYFENKNLIDRDLLLFDK